METVPDSAAGDAPAETNNPLDHDPACVFCRIVRGEVPADVVVDTGRVVAVRDRDPQAPTHVLLIPKRHTASLAAAVGVERPDPEDANAVSLVAVIELGLVLVTAARVAAQLGLAETGYRVVVNTGRDAGQTVAHVHAHVLGGRELGAMVEGGDAVGWRPAPTLADIAAHARAHPVDAAGVVGLWQHQPADGGPERVICVRVEGNRAIWSLPGVWCWRVFAPGDPGGFVRPLAAGGRRVAWPGNGGGR
jgi:histidine triad (HIT) family protein